MAILLLLALALGRVHGQPARGGADLERIRGDIATLKERLDQVRRQARSAEQELEASDLELGIRTRELQIAVDMHAQLEQERVAIASQIATLVEGIQHQKQYLGKRLVALYRLGSLSYVRVLLSMDHRRDPGAAFSMLTFLAQHDARTIRRFEATRNELDIRNAQLTDRQRRIAEAAKVIEQRRSDVAAASAEKARLLAALRSQEAGSQRQIAELEEKARRLERLVDLLSRQKAGVIAKVDVQGFRGALGWPIDGKVIEQFGRRRNAKFATYTMNHGVKIAAAPGTPVDAVFQGTVLFSQWFKGYGNLIIVDHGNRVFSLYGNLAGPSVAVGDRVLAGQAIAVAGDGEEAGSGYLYFEIRRDNKPEDPQKWLR